MINVQKQGAGKMTTYSLPTPKMAVSRSNFLHVAAILSNAILAIGYAEPVSAGSLSVDTKPAATVDSPSSERTLLAQASGEDTLARCQQLYGLFSRHNSDGYARPLDVRMGLEACQKGNIASGIATLKRALERAQIPRSADGVGDCPASFPQASWREAAPIAVGV